MMEVKSVPELRFKGFSGIWDSSVLGEVASFYKGKGLPKSAIQDDGFFPCIHYGELFTNYSEVIKTVTSKTNQNDNFVSSSNDVLMPTSDVTPKGLVKSCCVKQSGVVLGGDILVIRPNDQDIIDGEFLSRFIRTREQQVLQNVTGSTVFHLYASSIEKLDVAFPSIEQQKVISTFFKNLDDQITFKQRKLDKLVTLKKAMLEKMFPKEGADEPEIRFKGFSGAWEMRTLGELGSVAMNKRIFKEQTNTSGEIPFFKIGTFGGEPDSFISKALFKEYKQKYPYPNKGDLLISASGSIGRIVKYDGKDAYFQDSNIVWLKHDGNVINSFLRVFYMIVKWNGLEGSTIKRLYNRNILDTQIYLPSQKEQKQIGSYFKNLDELISLQKKELTKLKQIKSSCLEKMFV